MGLMTEIQIGQCGSKELASPVCRPFWFFPQILPIVSCFGQFLSVTRCVELVFIVLYSLDLSGSAVDRSPTSHSLQLFAQFRSAQLSKVQICRLPEKRLQLRLRANVQRAILRTAEAQKTRSLWLRGQKRLR